MQASSGTPCEAEQRGARKGIARISGCDALPLLTSERPTRSEETQRTRPELRGARARSGETQR